MKALTYEFVKAKFEDRGYSLLTTEYKGDSIKMDYLCPNHGVQSISYGNLRNGKGCRKCGNESIGSKLRLSIDDVSKLFELAGYKLLETKYINNHQLLKYLCPKHGEQKISYNNLQGGAGCPRCNGSKGERGIQEYLDAHEITYASEYTFKDLECKGKLRFDFCIFGDNGKNIDLLIEYQGIQHYEPVAYFGGEDKFEIQKYRDQLKVDYCKLHNIPLLTIKYSEFSLLEDILNNALARGGE